MTATISRRQILSRSRDAGLDALQKFAPYEDYEEMWFTHEQLFKDHISEVLRKWEQIDDEIWAKMIFMSRNRRIAKAYVRVPAVIVNGSEDGFDGYRVGLNGFEDPFRDAQTDKLMAYIDECRIGIDGSGNIIIKRYSNKSGVFIKSYAADYSQSCISSAVIQANGSLAANKPYIIFDMRKFESAISRELKCAYPDRRRLEHQCLVVIGFVRDHPSSILDLPIYVMFINIVALDLLKSKLNPVIYQSISQPLAHVHARNGRQNRRGDYERPGSSGTMKTNGTNGTTTTTGAHNRPHHQMLTLMKPRTNASGTSGADISNRRISGRNELRNIRVPDFVSIFDQSQNGGSSANTGNFDKHNDLHDDDDGDFEFDSENEEEDDIYGRIGGGNGGPRGGDISDDYISDYEYRNFDGGAPPNRGYSSKQRNGYSNASVSNSVNKPMISTIRSTHPHQRIPRSPLPPLPPHPPPPIPTGSGNDSEPPPKLPPRDKKKLSKQIDTIKKSRKQDRAANRENFNQNYVDDYDRRKAPKKSESEKEMIEKENPYSIQIPSPDYLEDNHYQHNQHNNSSRHHHNHRRQQQRAGPSDTIRERRKSWSPLKHADSGIDSPLQYHAYPHIRSNQNALWSSSSSSGYAAAARNSHEDDDDDDDHHLYDTMSKRSKSMLLVNGANEMRKSKSKPTAATSTSALHSTKCGNSKSNSQSYRVPMMMIGDDEDPYYSGLEARVSSKKFSNLSTSSSSSNNTATTTASKNKGLQWMMRKVLSSNYMNILTSKRRRKSAASILPKSDNDDNDGRRRIQHHNKISSKSLSSAVDTDSDPYMSIAEVYEPIYGYCAAGRVAQAYSNPFWPTMQRRTPATYNTATRKKN